MPDADVILELPSAWFANPDDGDRHRRFYASIWLALADLGVTVRPITLRFGADAAPRLSRSGQLVISFHSRGPADNVLRVKESYLPPYYTMDPMGYSGFSELAQHPERFADAISAIPDREAQDFVATLKTGIVAANLSKYRQPTHQQTWLPENFVFQPLQTTDDPVAALCRLDQMEVLETLAQATAALGWAVVVKRHPLCKSASVAARLDQLLAHHSHLILSDSSIHPLISASRAVIGANSGVLFEALLHRAHVISFGHSDFSAAVTPIAQLSDIAGAIVGQGRIDHATQCRFVTWYLQRYCVMADDVDAIRARVAVALAGLDRIADQNHQAQLDLFNHYAQQEARRRQAILSPPEHLR